MIEAKIEDVDIKVKSITTKPAEDGGLPDVIMHGWELTFGHEVFHCVNLTFDESRLTHFETVAGMLYSVEVDKGKGVARVVLIGVNDSEGEAEA